MTFGGIEISGAAVTYGRRDDLAILDERDIGSKQRDSGSVVGCAADWIHEPDAARVLRVRRCPFLATERGVRLMLAQDLLNCVLYKNVSGSDEIVRRLFVHFGGAAPLLQQRPDRS